MVYTYSSKVSRKAFMVGIFHERIGIQLLSMICCPLNITYQKSDPVFQGKGTKEIQILIFLLRSP